MGPGIHHGHSNGGVPGLHPWTLQWWGSWFIPMDTPLLGVLVYTMDIPMVGVLIYNMDTPVLGALVYTPGHSSGGSSDLYSWTLHFGGPGLHYKHSNGGGLGLHHGHSNGGESDLPLWTLQ